MKSSESNMDYLRAKGRVEKLKQFYTHLAVYLIFNTVVTILKVWRNMANGETLSEALFDFGSGVLWIVWGIVIAIHAFSVFGLPFLMGYDWEERKIEEYMNKELSDDSKE